MKIIIPKEIDPNEDRVAISPKNISKLKKLGYDVYIQSNAGLKAKYTDEDYLNAGANIVDSADYTDGLMDIVLVKDCSHIDLAGIFFSVLSNSGINNKNVIIITTNSCTINGPQDIVLSIDGEKGPCLPVSVRFINKALKEFTR